LYVTSGVTYMFTRIPLPSTATLLCAGTAGAVRMLSAVFGPDVPRAEGLRAPRRAAGLTLTMKSTPSRWSGCWSIQIPHHVPVIWGRRPADLPAPIPRPPSRLAPSLVQWHPLGNRNPCCRSDLDFQHFGWQKETPRRRAPRTWLSGDVSQDESTPLVFDWECTTSKRATCRRYRRHFHRHRAV